MSDHNDTKLTALLLLKDRSAYTWRWMSYANKVKFPFKVYIADGGKDDSVAEILNDKSHFPNVNYEYVRYPYDETYLDYYKKIADSLSRIDTPYVAQVCNDDFSFIDAFRNAIEFLEVHESYAAYGGPVHDFIVEPGMNDDPYTKIFGPLSLTGRIYPAQSLVEDSAIDRVRAYLEGIVNSFMWVAVHRKEYLQSAYAKLVDVNPGDLRFSDHFIYLLTLAAGKVHAGEEPISLHQANTKDGIGGKLARQFPTYIDWIKREGWSNDFSAITSEVGKVAVVRDNMTENDAEHKVLNLYFSFLGRCIVSTFSGYKKPDIDISNNGLNKEISVSEELANIISFVGAAPLGIEQELYKPKVDDSTTESVIINILKRIKAKIS